MTRVDRAYNSFALPLPSQDGLRHRLSVPGDWRRPAAPGHYDLWWREADGYGAILPRPDPEAIAGFYQLDDYYTHSAAAERDRSDAQGRNFWWRVLLHLAWRRDRGVELSDAVLTRDLGPAPLSVLEVGCGGGDMLRRLRGLGHQVTGLDPDPAALEQAASVNPSVPLHPGSAEAFPAALNGQRFDAIVMLHVLEHCLDPLQALRNCHAALKPGGRIIIEVPNNESAGLDVYGATWFWLDVPRHLNFFTARSLAGIARTAGFSVSQTDYTGYARQFTEDWRRAHERIAESFGRAPRSSLALALRLLAKTLFAPAAKRYDSLRILAQRPGEQG